MNGTLSQDQIVARTAGIYEAHGGPVDPAVLHEQAAGMGINADALFKEGQPDKAEAEGLRAQQLEAEADFLLQHSGIPPVESDQK